MKNFILVLFAGLFLAGGLWHCSSASANPSDPPAQTSSPLAAAAAKILASLSPSQRDSALHAFDSEARKDWHYTPHPHTGVDWRSLSVGQRALVTDLLQIVLSEKGYEQTRAIMELENILRELENRPPNDERRNPERYYFSLFGDPAKDAPWGWRFEGHHVSLNFSSVGEKLAATPSFFGTNPHEIPIGPQKGHRILDQEEDLALELMDMLSPDQLRQAIIDEQAPADMLTANHPAVDLEGYRGIPYPDLSPAQQKKVRDILNLYLNRLNTELAEQYWQRIRDAGLDNIYFAWAGPLEPNQGQYYRIHGPRVLIEYDNTQNDANHVHSVLRDPSDDWGADLLRQHYEQGHDH